MIIDLAAERGGNCELTKPDQRIVHNEVLILGPTNLPSEVPYHASQMYSHNVIRFLLTLLKDGRVTINEDDQIVRETLAARDGNVVQPRLRELLGI